MSAVKITATELSLRCEEKITAMKKFVCKVLQYYKVKSPHDFNTTRPYAHKVNSTVDGRGTFF